MAPNPRTIRIAARIDSATKRKLEQRAAKANRSESQIVDIALRAWLDGKEQTK